MGKVGFDQLERNLRYTLSLLAAHAPGGEVRKLPGISIACASNPCPMFNAALLSATICRGPQELAQRVALAALHYRMRGKDWSFWLWDDWMDPRTRRKAPDVLADHGLRFALKLPGMSASSLRPCLRYLPELKIRLVDDLDGVAAFCGVGATCFNLPIPWFRQVYGSVELFRDGYTSYVGYVDQEPICTIAVVFNAGGHGVYGLATLPEHQRSGYAEALLRRALEDSSRIHGGAPTLLQATPQGLSLYLRLGYEVVSNLSIYTFTGNQ